MASSVPSSNQPGPAAAGEPAGDWKRYLAPLGRSLLVLIFLPGIVGHFTRPYIEMAAQQGVPLPGLLVPLSGIIAFAGAVSVLLGYRAKIGGWLLVVFLVPVTVFMHRFWGVSDPMMAQLHQAMFLKNLSMLGGALLVAYWGAGPVSLDARGAAGAWR